jgi:hypothetical protein
MAACGSGTPSAVKHGPTALPPPEAHTASSSLCKTYFGSPLTIAKEFGAASLKLTGSGPEQGRPYSIFDCEYIRPGSDKEGLLLALTTKDIPTDSSGMGGNLHVGKAGRIYAYANTPLNEPVPQNIQVWLQKAAARAKPPQ